MQVATIGRLVHSSRSDRGLCNAKRSSRETGIPARSGRLADVWDGRDALSGSRQRLQCKELGLVAVKAARVVWARERHESLII